MPYGRNEKARLGFGSMVGGAPPCANYETEPVEDSTGQSGDPIFCSAECRAESEGTDES